VDVCHSQVRVLTIHNYITILTDNDTN